MLHRRDFLFAGVLAVCAGFFVFTVYSQSPSFSETEPGFEEPEEYDPYGIAKYKNWVRPDGPLRVGLQVGHWMAEEAPEEQINLRKNTGATAAGYTERAANQTIAELVKALLEEQAVVVDLLPTTIPPEYWADVFVSIHADGNENPQTSGYKIAAPSARRDLSGKAQVLADTIADSYAKATGLPLDPNITRNMRGYYAFNWRRYEHSIHPMTPAAIVETGFISSPSDRKIIVQRPEKAAEGIANGILIFLGIDPEAPAKAAISE